MPAPHSGEAQMVSLQDTSSTYSLDDIHTKQTRKSMDEAEDVMGKRALGHVAFSPLPSLQASSLTDLPDLSHCDDKESIVRYVGLT